MAEQTADPEVQPSCGILPDLVETHGRHLLPPPSTPVHGATAQFDPAFYEALCHRLRWLQEVFPLRERIYAAHAAESRPGHTPPTLRAQHQTAEHNIIRDFICDMSPPTPGTPIASPTRVTSPARTPTPSSTVPTTPPSPAASLPTSPRRREKRPLCTANKRKRERGHQVVGSVPKRQRLQDMGKATEVEQASGCR